MTYENAAIQKAIDETVIAQQLKVVSEAKFSSQQNDRMDSRPRPPQKNCAVACTPLVSLAEARPIR